MDDESERIWKDAIVTLLSVLSQHLVAVNEETHENLSQDSWSLD
jgi:hypothetical protein